MVSLKTTSFIWLSMILQMISKILSPDRFSTLHPKGMRKALMSMMDVNMTTEEEMSTLILFSPFLRVMKRPLVVQFLSLTKTQKFSSSTLIMGHQVLLLCQLEIMYMQMILRLLSSSCTKTRCTKKWFSILNLANQDPCLKTSLIRALTFTLSQLPTQQKAHGVHTVVMMQ